MQQHPSQIESMPGNPLGATVWAAAIAAIILITVVLPAEYGIDWTGAGRILGLTKMGRDKVAASKAAPQVLTAVTRPAESSNAGGGYATRSQGALRHDALEIVLAPNAEVEYKAILAEGEPMVFSWDAQGAALEFDFHGEPAAGPGGMFLSFEKGSAAKSAGSLRAPFTGTHGWYWKNETSRPVVIKLTVSGMHTELKRM